MVRVNISIQEQECVFHIEEDEIYVGDFSNVSHNTNKDRRKQRCINCFETGLIGIFWMIWFDDIKNKLIKVQK